jgi:hypothetical protein
VQTPLIESLRFVPQQRVELGVRQRHDDALLDPKQGQRRTLGRMSFVVQPETEGIQRLDVRVARNRFHRTLTTKCCNDAFVKMGSAVACARWNALNAVSYHSIVLGVTFFK